MQSDAAVDDVRANALAQIDMLHEGILAYHKQFLQGQAAKEVEDGRPKDASKQDDANQENVKLVHELRESLQQALRRKEELTTEMAASRLQEVQWKRQIDQLKHHQTMLTSQLQHQQATHDAQRKQLQMKDTLLTNYRSSIRTLENKLISNAKR
ncbi:hypothetical protein SPRG_19346 [Saprolegnia parasitica CBS 223.65]|uniref:Uncharacterized protein n=1 Tax=Saprolegnia parasitica (strain CBS 223.65) TaxID=695850 RepID=A0A067CWX7_SAPPC|nr:hypothetical protein SPRG_19346 [Saprolegnia parasitica CBS 223.65]KDO33740.1 hypothetical protein SPRG_19346 [Saprolegnia parasitica CBS 223.65]|eukprot:XP_012195755.1 hypothetical protein SPRG_19346 [Saprolegnia parasitica CBS 223.65]